MDGGRRARDGVAAGALARPDERPAAGILGVSVSCYRAPPTGLLYDKIGWRGLLILGVLPALAVVWIRVYVKEPAVWVENRRIQREQKQEFRAPLLDIFRARVLGNTIMACLWMASGFVIYYSVYGHVRHPPAEGSASCCGDGCDADRAGQPGGVPGAGPGDTSPMSSAADGR